ncbi:MAG: LPS export ABC transporter permease LptG [Thermoanaerobaculia bacterium]
MKILSRYILREMVGPTALGFLFYTSIILMQTLFSMAGLIIKRSLAIEDVGRLLLYSIPNIVVMTLPMSLLFGILIAVGRLSADSEIIALRALGISTRQIYRPVFLFSFLMFVLNLYLMNFLVPRGNTHFKSLEAELVTSAVENEVKPRVFHDEFENLVIYIEDVDQATGQWKGVFVADNRSELADPATPTPQAIVDRSAEGRENDASGSLGRSEGQHVIVAKAGSLAVVKPGNAIWMNLQGAQTHFWSPSRPDRYDLSRTPSQRILLPSSGAEISAARRERHLKELSLRELIDRQRELRGSVEERVAYNRAKLEIHKKFAIPFACIAFGVLGLPLGITNRRGGKSSGFSLSIAIILFYYVLLNNGEQLAAAGRIPAFLAMWTPNIVLLGIGLYLLARANRDIGAQKQGGRFARLLARFQSQPSRDQVDAAGEAPSLLSRLDITFPNILDRYILREFLKVLLLVLVSVMALFIIVDYTEIARDAQANNIGFGTILHYYRFQVFQVLNWTLPISVLVATLVTFGMLAKNNEVTAIKSGGVSLYRVAVPVIVVAVAIAVVSYFVLDFILPYSNQRVAELKGKIEGRAPVTAAAQQKLWFHGKGRYIINFLSYDRSEQQLSQVQVFEFHPDEFRLTRRVFARTATWNGKAWSFEDGWMKSFRDDASSTFSPITRPLELHYSETPEDFETEVKTPDQMTYAQLRKYIGVVSKSGYSVNELAVKLYAKTSWPVISVVMALIALPFAFRMGKRGTLYGIGIALVLGIVYWMIFAIFTKFGEVGNLPPLLAAWAANILFAIAAVYGFLHVET